jgi:hypothetical protein
VAEGTDAARERVLAARAQLGDELIALEASARAAVDIPAKIKRSPAKAAAVAGGAGFLVVGGPRRVVNGVKRAVRGPSKPLPKSMLPDEIEKTLRKLGTDGDAVRGTLERDFADYAKRAAKDRGRGLKTLVLLSVARPVLTQGSKTMARWLFSSDEVGFGERLEQVRNRIEGIAAQREAKKAASEPGRPDDAAAAVPKPTPRTGSLRDDAEDDSGA